MENVLFAILLVTIMYLCYRHGKVASDKTIVEARLDMIHQLAKAGYIKWSVGKNGAMLIHPLKETNDGEKKE